MNGPPRPELGPGTGSVTEALLNRGLREDRLIAIEKSPKMADLLRARFPRARIITGDAFQLDTAFQTARAQVASVGTVFCSLPSGISAPTSPMISPGKSATCSRPADA